MHPTRTDFDGIDHALAVIAPHESSARIATTFGQMTEDLDRISRDVMISQSTGETCASVVLYPAFQGEKAPLTSAH